MRRYIYGMLILVLVTVLVAEYVLIVKPLPGIPPEILTDPLRKGIAAAVALIGVLVFYSLSSRAIRVAIFRAKGTEGDVKMLVGFWRFIVIFITLLAFLTVFLELGTIGAVLGAFGGMFIGWSLQAPVSGFAAWVLVTLKRPFRVGDRVQLPSYGLVGDVIDVSPMYTVLNQVGGAVGSEDAVGRHILIPNAMLFGNLVINYTPKFEKEELVSTPSSRGVSKAPAYMLDEVVVRITFTSDWDTAEKILIDAAKEVTADIIKETGQEPYIRSELADYYGPWMRLRYMTLAVDRPRITHEIVKIIVKDFSQNDKVDFAIPVMTAYWYKRMMSPFSVKLDASDLLNIGKRDKIVVEDPSQSASCPTCGRELPKEGR